MGEYTPTTRDVRDWYDSGREQNNWADVIDPRAEFDRWLVAHDAKVWDEGHDHCFHVEGPAGRTGNPYRHAPAGVWDVEQAKETP